MGWGPENEANFHVYLSISASDMTCAAEKNHHVSASIPTDQNLTLIGLPFHLVTKKAFG